MTLSFMMGLCLKRIVFFPPQPFIQVYRQFRQENMQMEKRKATQQQARSTAENPHQPDCRRKPGKLPAEPELLAETLQPDVQVQIVLTLPETLFKKRS